MKEVPAVFLDRDGVINRERGEHTWRKEDLELLPDVAEALRLMEQKGYLRIGISNQSGVGLGLYDTPGVDALHSYLHSLLRDKDASLDRMLYCPHHPTNGKCLCRKPGSLLIEKAIARFGVDVGASVMIGDKERDVIAAEKVGVRGILMEANTSLIVALKKAQLL